jgi:virulence factor Mce-like protein
MGSPVLIGSVTVLVTLVAVFLAYNANNGLPFVPTKHIHADFASGSNLVAGNEVREGGLRIGTVTGLHPVTLPNGETVARLDLKLDESVGRIPADTTMEVRPLSSLGLKYVQLQKGVSKKSFGDGATVPLNQTHVPVQFDDLFRMFDKPTRQATQVNLTELGGAFAGRGGDLNETIAQLPRFVTHLDPVMGTLADPRTDLAGFVNGLARTMRELAPVAGTNARDFADMATTFEAISHDPLALEQTIAESPLTLDTATRSLRVQRPFLDHTAAFSHDLRFAAQDLRATLPELNPALEVGTPVLRRSVKLSERTDELLRSLQDLAASPGTNMALRGLGATVGTLNPLIRFIGPYQTVCNGFDYFLTFLAEHVSEGDSTGTVQRALINSTAQQDNSVGSGGATQPANEQNYNQATSSQGDPMALHGQPYGAAVDSKGNADCESGQRGYMAGPLTIFSPVKPNHVVFDPHTPGDQGPTFKGRPRVPKGETFSANPETPGAALPPELREP